MNNIRDKVIIVTGATSGIGLAAARLFAGRGARLVLSARSAGPLEMLARELSAACVAGDLRDEDVSRRLVAAATERFGGLDAAFDNAGSTGSAGPIESMSVSDWRATLDANLTSAFLCAKHQIPALAARGGGSIVFTSSFVGSSVGFPGLGAYAAAKAGLVGLVRTLAVEGAASKIRVNAILPGGIDTPANVANQQPDLRPFIEGLHAVKRLGRAEEIAEVAAFLASDACPFLTGAAIAVDGGVSITRS